ncbi:hypothetical protein AB1Y20_004698 [Prymnesium parvum]|uniref:Calmodulin n=1 Tax=Prymnesium parvum TaxID=97485 RepID=A0AB34IX10_PRYPA
MADAPLDSLAKDFAPRAAHALRSDGLVRVRLAPPAHPAPLLLSAASFFGAADARRLSAVAPPARAAADERCGYVREAGREFFELHPRALAPPAPRHPAAAALLREAAAAAGAWGALCEAVVEALARESEGLADYRLLSITSLSAIFFTTTSLSEASPSFSASMLRVHQYTADATYPPHCDLGLLTLAPRGSVPGLLVQPLPQGPWLPVEEWMAADEALLFAGSTLAEVCGIPALPHRVARQGQTRLSAPFFLRASPHVKLPRPTDPSPSPHDPPPPLSAADFVARKIDERRAMNEAIVLPTVALPSASVASPPLAAGEVAEATALGLPVCTPCAPAPARRRMPARAGHLFFRLDADGDGRVTAAELREGLLQEFGPSLPTHAAEAIGPLFEAYSIGDFMFAEQYVDQRQFNIIFAEILFARFDSDNDGYLNHDEVQEALKFLVRPPKDGSPKPDIHFACPPGAYTSSGELRLARDWFAMLYRNME